MAHRNFERLIEEGEKLEKQSAAFVGLYANEARKLYDLREDTLQLIETAYRAGLADGYRLRKREERKAGQIRTAKEQTKRSGATFAELSEA